MKPLKGIFFIALCLAITGSYGCKSMTPEERAAAMAAKKEKKRQAHIRKLKNIGKNEIYIVGRIDLVPALGKNEQDIHTFGTELRNHIMAFFSGRRVDPLKLSMGMMKDVVNVPIGDTFIMKRRYTDTMYYSGGLITLSSRVGNVNYRPGMMGGMTVVNNNRLFIPGGFSYKTRKGTKALYVGTLKIYRDKNNRILKTRVANHYKSAARHLRKTLGSKIKLSYAKPKKLKAL